MSRTRKEIVYFAHNKPFYVVQGCLNLQTAKTFEKPLDKWKGKCYNNQAVNERRTRMERMKTNVWMHRTGNSETEYHEKKLKKLLKNPLTKARRCDIMSKHFGREARKAKSAAEAAEKNLKIFQKTFQKPLDKSKRM